MKKRINKIWGVGLVVVILVSLLMMTLPATPASAAPLRWAKEGIPAQPGMLVSGSDVTDLAVGADGTTIYAATGSLGAVLPAPDVYKSIDGGLTWVPVPTTNGGNADLTADLVAVAPDNSNLVVAADTATGGVYVSANGGAIWKNLNSAVPGIAAAVDLDVSAAGPTNYLVVVDGATIWYYDLGLGGAWTDPAVDPVWVAGGTAMTGTTTLAARFSPNFASDQTLLVVTQDGAANTYLEVADLSGKFWNNAPFVGYPVTICTDFATNAYIAPSPDYLGSDDTARVVFVSLFGCAANPEFDGIYRVTDVNVKAIKTGSAATAFQIYSIAYDGTTLVGGLNGGSTVWRSTNALDSSPTFAPSAATKSPSGNVDPAAVTTVAFAGTNVVAGTTGCESAFSISTDGGKSFNDVALIDAEIVDLPGGVGSITGMVEDVAVSADGSVVYLLTKDQSTGAVDYTSLWRYASGWQRVLCIADVNFVPATADYIVRTSAADANIVYVVAFNPASKLIYYTKDGGVSRWYNRTSPAVGVADLAVESELVAYIATGGNVQKTANGGFTWSPPSATKLAAVCTLKSISEGNLIAGGNAGDVAYTTDSNANWTKIPQNAGAGLVQVTADGLAAGNNIYAADSATAGVFRWTIGQAATTPWLPIDLTCQGSGIALISGVLYESTLGVLADPDGVPLSGDEYGIDFIQRTTGPALPPPVPPFDTIATPGTAAAPATWGALPSALRVSVTADYVKLWILDTTAATGSVLYSFQDTLAVVRPALLGPADGTRVKITPFIATPYQQAFSWSAIPSVTNAVAAYTFELYLDKECTQKAAANVAVPYNGGPPVVATVVGVANPGTTYYWRVRAGGTPGGFPLTSPYSEVRSIITESPAAVVPGIASPINGAEITTLNPAFSWDPISGTTQYQFQLASNADFTNPIADLKPATSAVRPIVKLDDGMTYFWRVKVLAPSASEWSTVSTFSVKLPVEAPPVVITQAPAPTITMPPAPPATTITIPAPEPAPQIAPGYIWAIIIIGAILVIAVIVLVIRTRRTV